jgi:hypothetical protein
VTEASGCVRINDAGQDGVTGPCNTLRESAQDKAERLIQAEFKKLHWQEQDLANRLKGDPKKVGIALRLRR